MKLGERLQHLIKSINPILSVGGLTVADDAIRFVSLESGVPKTFALRLAPGVMESGRIKKEAEFKAALGEIHRQVGGIGKLVNVILSLPPALVYTQSFSVPPLEAEKMADSVRLNLQMISPIDFNAAYAGWQKIGETHVEGAQNEILGAFAESKAVDEITGALEATGFIVAAVEFPALSLTRLIARDPSIGPGASYVVLEVGSAGITFIVLRNSNLYFNHFHPWNEVTEEIGGKQITIENLREYLTKEIEKVLNFYSGKWGGMVDGVVLLTPNPEEDLRKYLEENFSVKVTRLTLAQYPTLAPSWFPVLGSALRGLLPRGEDIFLSLTADSVHTKYQEARTLHFFDFWRNIAAAVFFFILLLYIGVAILLGRQEQTFAARANESNGSSEGQQVTDLQVQAKKFNDLVGVATLVSNSQYTWSQFFEQMKNDAVGLVLVSGIHAEKAMVSLVGTASSTEAILRFRDTLQKEANITSVELPLGEIHERPSGIVDFNLSFQLKDLAS